MKFEDGKEYEGEIDEEYRPHGRGAMRLENGDIELGNWVHGVKDN